MTSEFTRRTFLRRLGGGGAVLGSGLLGGGLLTACDRQTGAAETSGVSDSTPRRGGRLRLGIVDGDQAGNLDAHKPMGMGSTIRGFALYSKLWEWSEDMTPRLALAEEVTVNADASAWTIRLRPGLEFHHGKTISADDVIFSILRLTDPALASPYANLVQAIDRDRIVKLDARTVRLHIREGAGFVPLPDTWTNFGGIVPTDYHPVTNPVGAGPYRIKQFLPGQRALFTRFENYFKPGQPYADELEIIDFKDQTSRLSALQSGQIDLANALRPEQALLLKGSTQADVLVSVTTGWQSFDLNLDKEPFRDDRVRRAFRLLVDREELVARALQGHGRIANDLYSPQDPAFNHGIAQRPHDVSEAKSLLKQAGYLNAEIELTTNAGGSTAALVFSEQARRSGLNLKVKQVDQATFAGRRRNDWTISTGGTLGVSFLATALHIDAPIAVSNKTHFRDPRFADLFHQALREPDLAKRRPLIHEAQQIQHDRGGLLIWGFANTLDGVSRGVGGAQAEASHFSTWRFEKMWLKRT
jgi:peptide/nickel transport system substrate-binding protein